MSIPAVLKVGEMNVHVYFTSTCDILTYPGIHVQSLVLALIYSHVLAHQYKIRTYGTFTISHTHFSRSLLSFSSRPPLNIRGHTNFPSTFTQQS